MQSFFNFAGTWACIAGRFFSEVAFYIIKGQIKSSYLIKFVQFIS